MHGGEKVGHWSAIVIQSGCHGSFLGCLDLELAEGGGVAGAEHRLIPVDKTIEPDPAMRAMVEDILAPHRAMLGRVVGHTRTALDRTTMLETTMDRLLLQAIAAAAGTRIALSAAGATARPSRPGRLR